MSVLTFDAGDVDELVRRFTLAEIKQEVAGTELDVDTASYYEGTPFDDGRLGFLEGYLATARLALDVARSQQPKPRPFKGKMDVEALKAQVDIVSVIGGYTQLRKAGARFTGRCPLHQDKSPSLVVYPDRQNWHCFGGCNTGGDVIAFIMKAENLDFKQAVARLGGVT